MLYLWARGRHPGLLAMILAVWIGAAVIYWRITVPIAAVLIGAKVAYRVHKSREAQTAAESDSAES